MTNITGVTGTFDRNTRAFRYFAEVQSIYGPMTVSESICMITVDETGVQVSSLSETLEEMQARLRATFGEDISLDDQTPLGQWTGRRRYGAHRVWRGACRRFNGR